MEQGRLALQAIVDQQAQLGGKESRVNGANKAIPASKARKVRLVRKGFQDFLGFQVFQVPLSSSQAFLGRVGATVRQDLQGLVVRTVNQPSLGPQDVRGRQAQKATPGLQP